MHKRYKVEDYLVVDVDFNTKSKKVKHHEEHKGEIPAVFLGTPELSEGDLCVLNSSGS